MEQALPLAQALQTSRLGDHRLRTSRQLLVTTLFMPLTQHFRPWSLRAYTGGYLALLSGRGQAYGYRTVEQFLSEVAAAGGSDSLSNGLAQWTYSLWQAPFQPTSAQPATFYVDGHHKAVC